MNPAGWIAALCLPACCLASGPAIAFEDVVRRVGVHFVLSNGASGKCHLIETMVSGAVAFDCDSDGHVDLYFGNGRGSNRLYRNRGNGRFE